MQKSGYTRFFILVSSKPLYPQKGYNDERILTSAELYDINSLLFKPFINYFYSFP